MQYWSRFYTELDRVLYSTGLDPVRGSLNNKVIELPSFVQQRDFAETGLQLRMRMLNTVQNMIPELQLNLDT